ncbi:MAG: amidohydrolase family protein [Planctomycetota bacterium]
MRAFCLLPLALVLLSPSFAHAQIAVRGRLVHTMQGPPIADGIVVIRDGKIVAVGRAADVPVPAGFRTISAAVVTPGLIDAHSVVGLSGILNQRQDQDQLERSEPIQPELRAIDAYNPQDPLIAWLRSFGVTTLHTGHAPGELISGQTTIVKTTGNTVEDALVVESAALAATLGPAAQKVGDKSPGTRAKMLAMLRGELVKAEAYRAKRAAAPADQRPERNLRLDVLAELLEGKRPLLITAHRAQDIASALRLAREFKLRMILDGAAEATLVIDQIKAAGVPVILHPTMIRAVGEAENMSFETAARLRAAGISVALQSGYESYVPKTRVVLFEAAVAAANGLGFEAALATITRDAAQILGIERRVGSLGVGMDGDVALFDGDPFEYTSHCIGTVINGQVVSEGSH